MASANSVRPDSVRPDSEKCSPSLPKCDQNRWSSLSTCILSDLEQMCLMKTFIFSIFVFSYTLSNPIDSSLRMRCPCLLCLRNLRTTSFVFMMQVPTSSRGTLFVPSKTTTASSFLDTIPDRRLLMPSGGMGRCFYWGRIRRGCFWFEGCPVMIWGWLWCIVFGSRVGWEDVSIGDEFAEGASGLRGARWWFGAGCDVSYLGSTAFSSSYMRLCRWSIVQSRSKMARLWSQQCWLDCGQLGAACGYTIVSSGAVRPHRWRRVGSGRWLDTVVV